MANQWFFAAALQVIIVCNKLLIKSSPSKLIVGQYIASLALGKHVSAPRWLTWILISITFGMMTRFPLKIAPL